MTIDEAIKVLENERRDHHSSPTDIIGKAEALGIEALKWIKWRRKYYKMPPILPLRGETKE